MFFMTTTACVTIALVLLIFFTSYKRRPGISLYATTLLCVGSSILAFALENWSVLSITLAVFVGCGLSAPLYLEREKMWKSLSSVFLAWALPGLPILLAAVAEVVVSGRLLETTNLPVAFVWGIEIFTFMMIFVPITIALDPAIRDFIRVRLHRAHTHTIPSNKQTLA